MRLDARRARLCCLCCLLLLLAACKAQVELHRQLSEQDANEVVAELADKRIRASKRLEKDGVTVSVDSSDMTRAVRVLEAAGLPRRSRTSLGEIFRKEGIVSTPLEERARYLYALSQELEATLSQMDGVIVARVHVVLPERIAPGEPVQPASASVFIKHTAALDEDSALPRIRHLVTSGLPGMANEAQNPGRLSVIFSPAAAYHDEQRLSYWGPFLVPAEDTGYWTAFLYATLSAALLALVLITFSLNPAWREAVLAWLKTRRQGTPRPATATRPSGTAGAPLPPTMAPAAAKEGSTPVP